MQLGIYLGFAFLFVRSVPFNASCLMLFFAVAIIFNFVRVFYWLKNAALIVTSETIKYKNAGIVVETSWNMIEDVEKIFLWSSWTKQDCLVVDNSNIKISTAPFAWLLSPETKPFNIQKAVIPLSCFAEDWRNSEIGQQIKEYAPHLFK